MALEWLIRRGEQHGSLEPRLATSWDLAPDNSSYTFHLRTGVKFHDGTDFNAAAVKFNFDKCIETKRPQFKDVTSVVVVDDSTVRVNINNWNSMFILNFGSDSDPALIMSPASYQKNGEPWALTHPVGTGPYKLKDYKDKTYIKWERNESYWEKGVPYLDGVETIAIPDYLTMVASLKSGEIQGAGIDFITAKQVQSDTNFRTWVSFNNLGVALTMNEKDPASVWYNKKMRQALEYAIDKEKITRSSRRFLSGVMGGIHGRQAGYRATEVRPRHGQKVDGRSGLPGWRQDNAELFLHLCRQGLPRRYAGEPGGRGHKDGFGPHGRGHL
jgi:peptide/nickel transport system substrate-binding protein